jgi:hypothetical protein
MWLRDVRISDIREPHPVFAHFAGGIPAGMQDSEELPDDVPVADAVEQQRAPSEPVLDEEATAEPPDNPPLEATPSDWQEQREMVDLDPDEGMSDE